MPLLGDHIVLANGGQFTPVLGGQFAWIFQIQSHMIKTPLARLIGFSNALEKGIVSETDKPVYLKYIKESANELDCVIREIKSATLVN